MSEKDQFGWMAHEATIDLNLSPQKEQELADILEAIAQDLMLTSGQLRDEVKSEAEKHIPAVPEEPDEADWWKE